MAGGVDKIEGVNFPIACLVFQRDTLGLDGNQTTAVLDKAVGDGGFAMIDMGDDGKISDFAQFGHAFILSVNQVRATNKKQESGLPVLAAGVPVFRSCIRIGGFYRNSGPGEIVLQGLQIEKVVADLLILRAAQHRNLVPELRLQHGVAVYVIHAQFETVSRLNSEKLLLHLFAQ